MAFDSNHFDDSLFFNDRPISLYERLGYVKQLVFSRTKLEFRLLWNKVFQKEDEELGWLLNPYSQNKKNVEATMMSTMNRNVEESYQFGYQDVAGALGRERVTIYNRSVTRKSDGSRKKRAETKSFTDNALDIARYMGMGVYMTSTSFPSPFLPVNDNNICSETFYTHNMYSMSKIW